MLNTYEFRPVYLTTDTYVTMTTSEGKPMVVRNICDFFMADYRHRITMQAGESFSDVREKALRHFEATLTGYHRLNWIASGFLMISDTVEA